MLLLLVAMNWIETERRAAFEVELAALLFPAATASKIEEAAKWTLKMLLDNTEVI